MEKIKLTDLSPISAKKNVDFNKIKGIFENCKANSYDFMLNKKFEKQLEDKKC